MENSWSGAHQSVAAAVASERGRRRSTDAEDAGALGAGLGPNGQLGRLGHSWAEPSFGPGCGECARVFKKTNTEVVLNNSSELIKTPQ